jgi:deoxyribonuclease IV
LGGESQHLKDRAIGIHVSISKQIDLAFDRAIELGCLGAFQIFTCSPRRWAAKDLDHNQVQAFLNKSHSSKFQVFAHMPYMPNLASPDKAFHSQSIEVLAREIRRCAALEVPHLVVHFGSHQGSSIAEGHERVIRACKQAIHATEGKNVRILLETSAGTRNSVGSKFEYVGSVLKQVDRPARMGACFDTCHVFASGYDLRTPEAAEKTIEEFDRLVGLKNLYAIHVNDSKAGLGEARDRHEHIGLGKISDEGFRSFFALKKIEHIPLILETPIDQVRDDKENLAHAKTLL